MKKQNSIILTLISVLLSSSPLIACEKYQVREIQKILNFSGYQAGKPDGIWGSNTDSALKASGVTIARNPSERVCDELISHLLNAIRENSFVDAPYTSTDTFRTYSSRNQRVIRYLYPVDIDGDPEQELIIAGFQSQGNPDLNPKPTLLNIFDWNEYGYLVNRDDLFLNNADKFFGGVGDLVVGDFNGDGQIDIFLSGYTDSNFKVPVYALYGGQNKFSKRKIDSASWQHGVATSDFNGDGFDDVIATGYHDSPSIYMGSNDGLIKYRWVENSYPNGSGVTASDLNNDGQIEIVISDNSKLNESNNRDINIYNLLVNQSNRTAKLIRLGSLPTPDFEKSFWQPFFTTKKRKSHDIRVKSTDMNDDGLNDVVLFSVARNAYKGKDANISSIQVFINKGNLLFSDQTDEWLIGYRNRTNVTYSPVFQDLNNDGIVDLYSSEHDYDGFANSLQIFLSENRGPLIGVPEHSTGQILPASGNSEISTVLIGKNNENFIVRHLVNPGFNKDEYLSYRRLSIR